MLSIKDLSRSNRNGPYNKPMRVQVIAVGPPRSFTPAGAAEMKLMHYLSFASEDSWMKATLYDARKLQTIKEGSSIMLKNFIKRNEVIIVNEQTVVGKTSPVKVADGTKDAAYSAIYPKSTKTTISALQTADGSGLWTVEANITKLLFP